MEHRKELCSRCLGVKKSAYIHITEPNILSFHLQRSILVGKKSPEKREIVAKITKRVSALRNSNGGCLIIHIQGQKQGDKYLEFFDEFIAYSLQSLIQDGQLYTDAFERTWLSDVPGFESSFDFILLTVAKGNALTTTDFNTKLVTDNEMRTPTAENIARILLGSAPRKFESAKLRGLPGAIHESRRIQNKAFSTDLPRHSDLLKDVGMFVDFIWEELRLKQYITAFSKIQGGGSYYLGVTEERKVFDGYKTIVTHPVGFPVEQPLEILWRLHEKIQEDILILCDKSYHKPTTGFVKTEFHLVPHSTPPKHVLEVSVGFHSGLVFYDQLGPRTYIIEHGVVTRIDKEQWFDLFTKDRGYIKETQMQF